MREGEAARKGRRYTDISSQREALVRAYYAPVFAFVRSQVDSVERAKAIVADAFETLGEAPEAAPPLEPRILLFTRARLAVESERRLTKRPAAEAIEPGRPAGGDLLSACVKRLTRREQGVISLRFDGGLSCSDIALVMGMTEVEVMVLVLRALRRIKACMQAGARERNAGTQRSVGSAS